MFDFLSWRKQKQTKIVLIYDWNKILVSRAHGFAYTRFLSFSDTYIEFYFMHSIFIWIKMRVDFLFAIGTWITPWYLIKNIPNFKYSITWFILTILHYYIYLIYTFSVFINFIYDNYYWYTNSVTTFGATNLKNLIDLNLKTSDNLSYIEVIYFKILCW